MFHVCTLLDSVGGPGAYIQIKTFHGEAAAWDCTVLGPRDRDKTVLRTPPHYGRGVYMAPVPSPCGRKGRGEARLQEGGLGQGAGGSVASQPHAVPVLRPEEGWPRSRASRESPSGLSPVWQHGRYEADSQKTLDWVSWTFKS